MMNANDVAEHYSDRFLTDEDWGPTTEEEALAAEHEAYWIYCTSKAVSEKEVWKFAEKHPQMDVTTSEDPTKTLTISYFSVHLLIRKGS